MDDEYNKFLSYFESEKIETWENSYINYKNICKEIINLFQTQKEATKKKNEIIEKTKSTILKKTKTNDNNKNFNKALDKIIDENNNEIEYQKTKSQIITGESIVSREKIKSFFQLLDKEVKKLNVFYSSKEKDIYQSINKKIQNKSQIKEKPCQDILKEIDDLDYLNELCLQVLCFIYINIQALKSILRILDKSINNEDQSISYKYIKKFLSQNNSDLIYILSFKTLDETILSIQGILEEYKKVLENNPNYKNNIEYKKNFKDFKKNIKTNRSKFDEVHEKIFNELKEWKKYLDINLDLPSSSRNSIFKDTSFVGDSLEIKKPKHISKEKNKNINNNYNDKENAGLSFSKSSNDDSFKNIKLEISDLMNDDGNVSNTTKKLLSKENISNIRLFFLLVFFYSYSYFIIIPKILYILAKKIETESNPDPNSASDSNTDSNIDSDNLFKLKYRPYYGIIISLPILGNFISQQYIMNLIKWNFKLTLIRSLIYVILHYILFILGILIKEINILFIARFLLGLSSLDRLCKLYIDICVPETKQVKANQFYLTSIYSGNIAGIILSDLEILLISVLSKKKNSTILIKYEYFYTISCIIFIYISISVIISFNNPSNKEFKIINDSIAEYNKENRLLTKFLDKDEKEKVQKQEDLFENVNKTMPLYEDNQLKNYSTQVEKKKSSHFTKVFVLLIFFLITAQYGNESNLMFLSRIYEMEKEIKKAETLYNINENIYYYSFIGYILISLSYLITLLSVKKFLKKIFFKESSKIILIILFSLLFIFLLGFFLLAIFEHSSHEIIKNEFEYWSMLVFFGIFIMIFISELLIIVIINLFIGLLPFEKFKFFCCFASKYINITEVLSRLLPGLIYLFINTIKTNDDSFSLMFIIGIELFFILISIFCCIKCKYLLKSHSLTRIFNTKN